MRKFFAAALLSTSALLPLSAHAAPGDLTVLHNFQRSDGDQPGWLLRTAGGTLYGVTALGGDGNQTGLGVLYRIDAAGNFSVVHAFSDTPDGAIPNRLFQASSGMIYGFTATGGTHAGGTVFTIDGAGTYSVIHSFDPNTEGAGPNWLVERPDGSFYGTNSDQGVAGACPLHHANGTLFAMSATGQVNLLHTFCENIDGSQPGGFALTAEGLLYGTCREDGPLNGDNSNGGGTFWRAKPNGIVKRLHTFGPQMLDGNQPSEPNGVLQAPDGFFYGTADNGGGFSAGAIFRADAGGHIKVIHPFNTVATDGKDPESNFFLASDGFFYGTTSHGGLPVEDSGRSGEVYRADTKGHVWVLHSFSVEDGMQPVAQPVRDAAAKTIYVTAIRGGTNQDGTVGVFDEKKAIPISRLTLDDDTVVSGQSTTGTVKLAKPAPAGGQVVTLFSQNAQVPASVTVPEGQTSANFTIGTGALDFKFVTTVTASIGSLGASTTLTLLPSD